MWRSVGVRGRRYLVLCGVGHNGGDGLVVAEVTDRTAEHLLARITHGGLLLGRPGVHIPSDRLRIPSPTPDDLRMLDAFIEEANGRLVGVEARGFILGAAVA